MAPIILAGVAIGGAVMGAVGNIKKANAEAEAQEYNANLAEENARQTMLKASEDEQRSRFNSKLELGSIRAAYGASGVTMDGTATEVLEQNAAIAEKNALDIRTQGLRQAKAYQDEATLLRKGAKSSREAGIFQAIGSGLSSATNMYKRS